MTTIDDDPLVLGKPDTLEGSWVDQLAKAQARIEELEAAETGLNEYAVLKVRKSSMPPDASLVVCYDDGSGVPVISDDLYKGFVVARRDTLAFVLSHLIQMEKFINHPEVKAIMEEPPCPKDGDLIEETARATEVKP